MASPFRSTSTNEGNNGQDCNATPPGALAVVPLCSMPYIGPPAPSDQNQVKPVEKAGPTDETVNPGVHMLGSAAKGKVGNIVGLVDIGESDDAYMFRVSLPGVARGETDFSCNVESDGKVVIKGVTTTGEKTVCRHSQIFRMKTQNLCPPGHFSITFQLPGLVDKQQFKGCFGIDGILEGFVKKKK